MLVEWDETKARANRRKHSIDFHDAAAVFLDPWLHETIDDRIDYGEERLRGIGMIGVRVLFVVYTMRAPGRCRLISARRATRDEERTYRQRPR